MGFNPTLRMKYCYFTSRLLDHTLYGDICKSFVFDSTCNPRYVLWRSSTSTPPMRGSELYTLPTYCISLSLQRHILDFPLVTIPATIFLCEKLLWSGISPKLALIPAFSPVRLKVRKRSSNKLKSRALSVRVHLIIYVQEMRNVLGIVHFGMKRAATSLIVAWN